MSKGLIEESIMYDIGDAIREKRSTTRTYLPSEMPAAIREINSGGIQLPKLDNPGTADDLLQGVEMIDQNGTPTPGNIPRKSADDLIITGSTISIPAGYYQNAISKTVDTPSDGPNIALESIIITPTKTGNEIIAESGKAFSAVTVNPIPDQYQDISGVTAKQIHVLEGYKFVDNTGELKDGNIRTGSIQTTIDGVNTTRASGNAGYYSEVSVTFDESAIVALLDSL